MASISTPFSVTVKFSVTCTINVYFMVEMLGAKENLLLRGVIKKNLKSSLQICKNFKRLKKNVNFFHSKFLNYRKVWHFESSNWERHLENAILSLVRPLLYNDSSSLAQRLENWRCNLWNKLGNFCISSSSRLLDIWYSKLALDGIYQILDTWYLILWYLHLMLCYIPDTRYSILNTLILDIQDLILVCFVF
jgi:hypothetical protein